MVCGIIFDVDGTIVDTEALHLKTFHKLFEQFNIDYTEEIHKSYEGAGTKNIIKSVLSNNNIQISDNELSNLIEKRDKLLEEEVKKNGIELKKGFKEFLYVVKNKDIRVALATGLRKKELEIIFNVAGLSLDQFDRIVTIDEAKPKPDPEVFNKAISLLNCDAKECIIFEDSDRGIEAAKKANVKKVIAIGKNKNADLWFIDFIGVLIHIEKVLANEKA